MARRSGSRPLLPKDVNAKARAAQVVQLRCAGLPQTEIAERMGMSQSQVSRIIRKALEAQASEGRETLRALEMARMERLHQATWPSALKGNIGAAHVVMKASERRSRLQGLDEASDEGGASGPPVHLHVIVQSFVLNTQEDMDTLNAEVHALGTVAVEKFFPGVNAESRVTRLIWAHVHVGRDSAGHLTVSDMDRYRQAIRHVAHGQDAGIGV